MKKFKEIEATFTNGQTAVYTMAVFDLLKTEESVVHVTDKETGELLYCKAIADQEKEEEERNKEKMEIKDMTCTLTIKRDGETMNVLEKKGEKALLELAKVYRELNHKTRFSYVAKSMGKTLLLEHKTTTIITTTYEDGYSYVYEFNFDDRTDF